MKKVKRWKVEIRKPRWMGLENVLPVSVKFFDTEKEAIEYFEKVESGRNTKHLVPEFEDEK